MSEAPAPGQVFVRPEPGSALEAVEQSPWDRWGWAFAAIWLIFLIYPIRKSLQVDQPTVVQTLAVLGCVAFGIVNVLGYSRWSTRPLLAMGLMVALAAASIPVIGLEALGFTPYLGVLSALQMPDRWWIPSTVITALLPLASLLSDGGFPRFFFLGVWPIIIAGVLIRLFAERERRSEQTRGTLALVAERERVARDVHDVLGHSLTVLSVKAELAARLIDVDGERAKAELESIQEIAREALAEVRSTVGGLRAGNLTQEVREAPDVLADAGVATTIHGEVADTDPRHRTLLAWVLREATTNIVRHAKASSVLIEVLPDGLRVTDDGIGMKDREGNGLRGMRERVSDAGGTLTLTPGPTGGTIVEVTL